MHRLSRAPQHRVAGLRLQQRMAKGVALRYGARHRPGGCPRLSDGASTRVMSPGLISQTAPSRSVENSRPSSAAVWATDLAGPMRSRRAISDACRLAGTSMLMVPTTESHHERGDLLAHTTARLPRCRRCARPARARAHGRPPLAGSGAGCGGASMRSSVTVADVAEASHGGTKSGRAVTRINRPGRGGPSSSSFSTASVDGSAQWTSSHTIRAARSRAAARNQSSSKVCRDRISTVGAISGAPAAVVKPGPVSAASRLSASGQSMPSAFSTASSRGNMSSPGASGFSPARSSNWRATGCKALWRWKAEQRSTWTLPPFAST